MRRFRLNIVGNSQLLEAVQEAENLLENNMSRMIQDVEKKNDFAFNSGSGLEIAQNLLKPRDLINIYLYKSINPFSKAVGYFDGEAIWINSRKLPELSLPDLVGLLLHEYAHYCGFNHGTGWFANYKTADKCQYSVPYFLSSNVERWI